MSGVGRAVTLAAAGAAAWLSVVAPAGAQTIGNLTGGEEPIEITADEGIEWRRDANIYIARGNARAAQGDLTVEAEVLTAYYRKAATGGTEIYRIQAEGDVEVSSPSETVYGDRGDYDVDQAVFVLRGDDLRLITAEDRITARDSLEYWEQRQLAVARGDAVAIRGDKRIKADVLTAYFTRDAEDKLSIERVDGHGNVQVSTPSEYVRGDRGSYYVAQQLATLSGDVKITRGENQLNGNYAEVNLETGISRLLGAPPGSGDTRVRGLLIPRRKPAEGGS